MKKTKLFLLAALAAGVFVGAGCSNLDTSSSKIDSATLAAIYAAKQKSAAAAATDTVKTVSGTVTSPTNLVNFSANVSKSIVPTAFQTSELDFYLAYQNVGTTTWTVQADKITVTADASDSKKGTFLVTLPVASYNLRLYAVKSGTSVTASETSLNTNGVLVGLTSADLRRGDTISFTLKADSSILTGTSQASLVLYAENNWNDTLGYTVSAELQNITTGAQIDGTEAKDITLVKAEDASTASANYTNATALKAGTYNFVVKFTKSSKTYEYSDTIILVPGKTTTGIIGIPQVVETAPTAPSGFKAGYTEPASATTEYYNVEFVWTDNSNNESYFELQLADVDKNATTTSTTAITLPTDKDSWNTAANTNTSSYTTRYGVENASIANDLDEADSSYKDQYSAITNFYGSSNDLWVSGSLQKNNEVVTMMLPVGKRYVARISAVNASGRSDWNYVTIDTDIAEGNTTTHTLDVSAANAFTRTVAKAKASGIGSAAQCINLYRLTYSLGQNASFTGTGTVIPSASDTTYPISNNQIISYYNQNATDGIAILNPNGDKSTDGDTDGTADDLQLKQGTSYYWTYWANGGAAYNAYGDEPAAYKGYENLTLTAVYGATATIAISDPSANNITVDNVSVTTDAGDAITINTLGGLTVDTSAGTIIWKVTYPTGVTYDRVVISVTPTLSGSAEVATGTITQSEGTWEETVSSLTEGVYKVEFRAYTSSNATAYYSTTAYMTVTETK